MFYFEGIAVSGNMVYLAAGSDGLQIIDAHNPAAPVAVGRYDNRYSAERIAVSGNYVYVATGSGLEVIDVSILPHVGE
jgi:hypothetical protein